MNKSTINVLMTIILSVSAGAIKSQSATDYSIYITAPEASLWLDYSEKTTGLKIWSPAADEVRVHLYKQGSGGESFETHPMQKNDQGVWSASVDGDLKGTFYTYQVKYEGEWLLETPGIYAKAVGVNGQRAMVLDLNRTNPKGWEKDSGPKLKYPNEAVIYELHVRDMTIDESSGAKNKGKFIGLVETGTTSPGGLATGIDHLKELGITHVHLLPSFDFYTIDESRLDIPQFNWGYDPQNYNVPEGSYSTDPTKPEVRIREFKEMVKTFHDNGIGVILDVVYNHTGRTDESNFNQEFPGYYYRHWENGEYSNASYCGNETASERAMMRKFMIESIAYWMDEYHIDGFRFDLMGIHDIETMNLIAEKVKSINPNAIVYGEGWTAIDSPLPYEKRALKRHTRQMPQISAFSDDLRDGLKGSVFEALETGFVSGAKNTEERIKFGVVGSVDHPQVDYTPKDSEEFWADNPWQAVSYVTCHDNNTLYDKLKISRPKVPEDEVFAMDKLANAIVLTSQGTAFLHAGVELLRTKEGEENSFNMPDSINQIDWTRKETFHDIFTYYKNLVALRKAHPAFRMTDGASVRKYLEFRVVEDGLIAYQINGNANGDSWKDIYVIYNARTQPVEIPLEGKWNVAVLEDTFYSENYPVTENFVSAPGISMMVLFR